MQFDASFCPFLKYIIIQKNDVLLEKIDQFQSVDIKGGFVLQKWKRKHTLAP